MFRIFQKARSSALDENRMGRFVRYAIGEILLVVIGILIALQIDSWNDDRLDRQQEREYLASMVNDLRVDSGEIGETVHGNTILMERLDRLLDLLANPSDDPRHQRDMFMHSLVYTYWYLEPEFSELTMTQLKSSGNLLLIRDNEIRDGMLKYEQAMVASRHTFNEMKIYFHSCEETQKGLFNLVLGKQSFAYIEQDYLRILEPIEAFEPLVPIGAYIVENDPGLIKRYFGDVLMYRTVLNNSSVALTRQRQQGEKLVDLIRANYGIE